MLTYDVTSKQSFLKLDIWLAATMENARAGVVKYLIANKTDLVEDRVISTEMGEKFAEEHGLKYFETSAKDKKNVTEVFLSIANDICEQEMDQQNESIVIKNPENETRRAGYFCC